jgi:hypothetical protein
MNQAIGIKCQIYFDSTLKNKAHTLQAVVTLLVLVVYLGANHVHSMLLGLFKQT